MVSGPWQAARFFALVGLHPSHALIVVSIVAAIGMVTVWLDAREIDSGLGMILFAQMYLASSGFAARARQGHFDPILTSGLSRTGIVACHWLISIAPGLVAWLAVVAVAVFSASDAAVSALSGPRAGGLLIVSTLAWVAGFALPRGAAGMLWMAMLVALVSQRTDLLASRSAAVLLMCPFLLLGNRTGVSAEAVVVAVLVSVVALFLVWRTADRLDIYLVDRA
jgi:hypothetical protein